MIKWLSNCNYVTTGPINHFSKNLSLLALTD